MKAKVIKTGEIVDVYNESQHGQVTNIYYKESVLVNGRMWSEDELDFCIKANDVPEKIYIDNPTGEFDDHWYTSQNNYSIEYTRTDAFIEKAEKFFTEKFEVEDYNDIIDIDGSPIFNYGRFIEDFKNYMKGE